MLRVLLWRVQPPRGVCPSLGKRLRLSSRKFVGDPQDTPRRFKRFTSCSSLHEGVDVPIFRVFLNPSFGELVVCTLDSRGFRHFRGFRDFLANPALNSLFVVV